MSNIGKLKRGALVLPLDPTSTNTLLRDADPAIYFALEYFRYVVRHAVGDRFVAEATRAGRTEIADAVAHVMPADPKRVKVQEYLEFPLLAVYRVRDDNEYRTMNLRSEGGRIGVDFVLPPLSAAEAEQLSPVLHAVAVALDMWTEQGFDASFTPEGGVPGDSPWAPSFGCIEKISIDTVSYGTFPDGEGLPFYAISMQGTLKELDAYAVDGLPILEGIDTAFDVQDNTDESVVSDVVEISVDVPPPLPWSPAHLPHDGLWLEYAGGAWQGTPSAGPSAGRTLDVAPGEEPTLALIHGHGVAHGTAGKQFTTTFTLGDVINADSFSIWGLIQIDEQTSNSSISLLTDTEVWMYVARYGLFLPEVDAGIWVTDDDDARIASANASNGSLHIWQTTYDGTTLRFSVDDGPWSSIPCPNVEDVSHTLQICMSVGAAGYQIDWTLAALGVSKTVFSNAQFGQIRDWARRTYPQTS